MTKELTKQLPQPEIFDADQAKLNELQGDPYQKTITVKAESRDDGKTTAAVVRPAKRTPADAPVGSLEWGVEQMRRVQREMHAHLPALREKHESKYKPKNFKLQRKFGRTMPKDWEPPKPEVRTEDVEFIELFEGVFGTEHDWLSPAVVVPEDGPDLNELRDYRFAVYRTRKAIRLRYPESFLDLEVEPALLELFEPKPSTHRYRPTGRTCPKCKDEECWLHYDEENGLWLCFVCGKEVIDVEAKKDA